jgi:hypothetical protein
MYYKQLLGVIYSSDCFSSPFSVFPFLKYGVLRSGVGLLESSYARIYSLGLSVQSCGGISTLAVHEVNGMMVSPVTVYSVYR